MKRLFIIILALIFMAGLSPAYAAQDRKGASDQAYEHASDQSIFNRVSDWFATIGKSDEEKARILEERKAARAAKRAEKETEKAQKKLEEEQAEAEAQGKKMKKEMETEGKNLKKEMETKGILGN